MRCKKVKKNVTSTREIKRDGYKIYCSYIERLPQQNFNNKIKLTHNMGWFMLKVMLQYHKRFWPLKKLNVNAAVAMPSASDTFSVIWKLKITRCNRFCHFPKNNMHMIQWINTVGNKKLNETYNAKNEEKKLKKVVPSAQQERINLINRNKSWAHF